VESEGRHEEAVMKNVHKKGKIKKIPLLTFTQVVFAEKL
jgi:hypothetical protein